MNKLYKTALLAALGLTAAISAKAETGYDLLAGFTVGSGNDLIIDLGSVVSYPGSSTLFYGETWNLTSLLSGYNLNNVQWGVAGDAGSAVSGQNPQELWVTTAGLTPNTVNGGAAWSSVDGPITSILSNLGVDGQTTFSTPGQSATPLASSDNSWYGQTIVGAFPTDYINTYGNPNATGTTSDTLWQVQDNNSAPTAIGSFSLGSNGILTYSAPAAVPEPTTYALLAGGALLILSSKYRFRRQHS